MTYFFPVFCLFPLYRTLTILKFLTIKSLKCYTEYFEIKGLVSEKVWAVPCNQQQNRSRKSQQA